MRGLCRFWRLAKSVKMHFLEMPMTVVEKFKQYPLVLWALALYLCSLGFNLKYDIPLAIFAMASMFAISHTEHHTTFMQALRRHWTVIIFLIITVLVTLASRDVKSSIQVQLQLLPALLMYLTAVLYAVKEQHRRFIVTALVAAALMAELSFMAQALYLNDLPDRLEKMWVIRSPLFVAPNDVLFFSVLAPLAVYLLINENNRLEKILGSAYLILTLVVVMYMQSRQAVGVYLGGLFLMALLWRPGIGGSIIVAVLLLVLVADWLTGKGLLGKLVYLFPRRYVWEAAWQMFLDRPWLGHGPGMFKVLYVEYLEKSGYIFAEVEDRRPMNWAHSLYLEQLAERGLAGLLGLLLMVATAMVGLMKRLGQPSIFSRAVLASWIAYLVAGVAESSLLRLWVVITLFLLLGLTQSTKPEA